MKQMNRKTPVVFKISMVLLCGLFITTHLISGLYARYTTFADGFDSAVVATFEFSDNFDDKMETLVLSDMYPGDSREIDVEIKNNSETAIRCVVNVENLTNNLPVVPEEGIVVDSGMIAPSSSGTVKLTLEWNQLNNNLDLAEKMDAIRISVKVEQAIADN